MARRWLLTGLLAVGLFLYVRLDPEAFRQLTGATANESTLSNLFGGAVSAAFAALLNFLLPSRDVVVIDRAAPVETRETASGPTRPPEDAVSIRRHAVALRLALACCLCFAFASFAATVRFPVQGVPQAAENETAPATGTVSAPDSPESVPTRDPRAPLRHALAVVSAYGAVAALFGVLAHVFIAAGLLRALRIGGLAALCVNLSALLIALPYRGAEIDDVLPMILGMRLVVLPAVAVLTCGAGCLLARRFAPNRAS